MRSERWVFAALFVCSLLTFIALIPVPRVDGHLLSTDGVGYYIYARSLIIDHDLDFANEYAHFEGAIGGPSVTSVGKLSNKYAVGPAILWLPFYLLAHALALIGHMVGLPVVSDGYGYLYQAAICIGSIVYGTVGMGLAYACARRFFAQVPTLLAVVVLWFASNIVYYIMFEPSMSHMVSLFSVALALSLWFWWFRGKTYPAWHHAILLGISGGIVLLVRLQDAIFLLLPYTAILIRWLSAWKSGPNEQFWRWLKLGVVVGTMTLVTFMPQMLVWKHLYGTWSSPYMSDHDPAFYWFEPEVVNVLFSTYHGLFVWHPVVFLAVLGIPMVGRCDRWLAIGVALVFVLNLYVIAAWWAWWQGHAFGGRMFLNSTWIWVLGLSGLFDWLWQKPRIRWGVVGVGMCLIIWNGLSLVQYRLGYVPMSAPLTWEQMTVERLRLPWVLLQKLMG